MKLKWETIFGEAIYYKTEKDFHTNEIRKVPMDIEYDIRRAKIPGGWLVGKVGSDSITFVPDEKQEWK